MKISNRLWDEWLTGEITDPVSAESELAGLVSSMGVRAAADEKVLLSCGRFWTFRRVRRLWPKCPICEGLPLGEQLCLGRGQVALALPTEGYRAILAVQDRPEFLRWAWMRGVFGVCGGLYAPKSGYYCLMRLAQPVLAGRVMDSLAAAGIKASSRVKGGRTELILRDLDGIIQLCHNLKLPQTVQVLQNRGLVRFLRDQANRQANCDEANIRRSVAAARRQVELARFFLDQEIDLPEALSQVLRLRLSYPAASLGELGTLLDPQMSKSTIKYRWHRLQQLAEERGFSPLEEA